MLSSMTPLFPRDSHTLWYTPPHSSHLVPHIPSALQTNHSQANAGRQQQQQLHHRQHLHGGARTPTDAQGPQNDALAPHAALLADENAVALRKQRIANFGATWIRPPGVSKTYQAAMDEAAEREEAREAEAEGEVDLETELVDVEAEAAAQAQRIAAGVGIEGEGEVEEVDVEAEDVERDLDDDVPVAEEEGWGTESDEDDDVDDDGDVDDDVDDDGSPGGSDLDPAFDMEHHPVDDIIEDN